MKRKMKKWKNKKRKQGGCLVRGIKMKYKRLIDCEISKQTNCTNKQTRTEKTNMSSDNSGVTEDTSYHTGEEPGNLGMAWYKDNFDDELKKMGSKIKRTVEHGYRVPDLRPEDNPMLQKKLDEMSLKK